MFGWFRRKPGVKAFSAARNPRRLRRFMKSTNGAMRAPEGFEATISARVMPKFGAEIADSQSLRSAREALHAERAAARAAAKGRR